MPVLIRFLHVQKTGGSSIRAAIVQSPLRFALDYNATGRAPFLLPYMEEAEGLGIPRIHNIKGAALELRRRGINILLGHGPYRRWSEVVPAEHTFVMLRDPIQRIISQWQSAIRIKHVPEDADLVEFAERPDRVNLQTRALKGMDLDKACVGITEHFNESVRRINMRFGLQLQPKIVNVNPLKNYDASYVVEKPALDALAELNREDIELYERERARFEAQ